MRDDILEMQLLRFQDHRRISPGDMPQLQEEMRICEYYLLHPGMRRAGKH